METDEQFDEVAAARLSGHAPPENVKLRVITSSDLTGSPIYVDDEPVYVPQRKWIRIDLVAPAAHQPAYDWINSISGPVQVESEVLIGSEEFVIWYKSDWQKIQDSDMRRFGVWRMGLLFVQMY